MRITGNASLAGGYAHERYRRGMRAWRARTSKLVVVVFGPFMLAGIAVLFIDGQKLSWCAGAVTGLLAGVWMITWDSPPAYIENWGEGAEGERRTAKQLIALERSGWQVAHDIDSGHGNYDHVVVGPAGVFLLDSKNLMGIVEIRDGVPHLLRRLDPEADTACRMITSQTLSAAARLNKDLQQRTGRRTWVQAVVVFWSDFPQGIVEEERCVYVHGSRLQAWLDGQPTRLDEQASAQLAAAVGDVADSQTDGDTDNLASSQ